MSDEHLIPESLGGQLIAAFLCRQCNSFLGHRYEHAARSDPTVRLLANKLSAQIPVISSTLMENQIYTATGPGHGSRTGFMKDGEFHIAHRKEADGSLILSTPATRKTISRMLAKEGYDTQFINEALCRFDSGPENVQIELSPTRTAIKWEVTGLQMALNGPPIDPVVPVKTAFEFLALHIGGRIYDRVRLSMKFAVPS